MPESVPGMGRIVSKDDRDRKFLLPPRLDAAAIQERFWEPSGIALDQGSTSQCVGYSGFQWLLASPVSNTPKFTPTALYKHAQQHDEWPGDSYEGSSVRGLFKALHEEGYIAEYRWATIVQAVIDHLLVVGPIVVGTDWTERMFTVDDRGWINDDGGAVGGHAYTLIGASKLTRHETYGVGAVRVLNSWGPAWGQSGQAYLAFDALERLLKKDGEACTATELLK